MIDGADEVFASLSACWLDPEGRSKLLPAAEFQSVPQKHLMLWCSRTARYGIPTWATTRRILVSSAARKCCCIKPQWGPPGSIDGNGNS